MTGSVQIDANAASEFGITDRAGRKRLPIGNENFEQVLARSVYVDKSLLVKDLIDSSYSVVLFCRPRRC